MLSSTTFLAPWPKWRDSPQFTPESSPRRISPEKQAEVDRLLTERISHRGICRVTGVSRSWFRLHLKKLVETVPQQLEDREAISKKA